MLDHLLDANSSLISRIVVEQFGTSIGLGRLLALLDNSDRDVRIGAIKQLKSTNDVGALKMIIDHYETEVDPEVRTIYKDSFWVIKERGE